MNCTRVPRALSHTEIGNFPPPRPWKRSRANDNTLCSMGFGGHCSPSRMTGKILCWGSNSE